MLQNLKLQSFRAAFGAKACAIWETCFYETDAAAHTLYPGNLKLWEQIKIQQWMRNSSLLIWLARNYESRSKLNSEWGFILIWMHVGDVFFANAIEWCRDHQYQSNPNLTHIWCHFIRHTQHNITEDVLIVSWFTNFEYTFF